MKKKQQGNVENDGIDVTNKANDRNGADSLFTLYVVTLVIIIANAILLLLFKVAPVKVLSY